MVSGFSSKNIPVTRTKILPPRRRGDLLSRQRLIDLLYDMLDNKLVIISAPAGYGKTSLLIDLANQVEMPVCWFSLDADDRNFQRFINHLIVSIAQCFPDFEKASKTVLQSLARTNLDVDWLVTTIVNDVYENIQEHFIIILDDYHFVDGCDEIAYFINKFIQNLDESCHVVIASRKLLTLPDLSLMVGRSQAGGLGFEELAFRSREIQALILQNYHTTISESTAEELASATNGWITGLLLSAQSMGQGMADRLRTARATGVGLYEYLAQQVLDEQPAPVRDFLLRTSILDEFDAALCEAVLGPATDPGGENWHDLIETVLRNNLFVLPVGEDGTWLRYHHLFQDFLRHRLSQERPEEEARLLRRLASVYTEGKEWEKSYAVYGRLGDVAATADFIEQAGMSLVTTGRPLILAKWLDALPVDISASRPVLLSLQGWAAFTSGDVKHGLSLLDRTIDVFRTESDLPRLALTLTWRAVAHRFLGNYQASLADAEEVLAFTKQEGDLSAYHAEALRAKGLSLQLLGRLSEAVDCLEQSLATYNALGEIEKAAMLDMNLGMIRKIAGDYEQAEVAYRRALDHWRKTDHVLKQASPLNNLGVLMHFKGEYQRAVTHLEEALSCARRSGDVLVEAIALTGIGDLYADLDAYGASLDAYQKARPIAQRTENRFLLLYLGLAECAVARLQGDLVRSRRLIESAEQLAQEGHSGIEWGLYQLEAGRLSLAEGEVTEAIAYLENAVLCFVDGGQQVDASRANLYLAHAHQVQGDNEAAQDCLIQAFHLASGLESWHILVVAGREARSLLDAFRNDLKIGRQASRLLRQTVQFEHDIPTLRRRMRRQAITVPFAPPKLTFKALGGVQVRVNGRSLTTTDWQVRVARDLLFLILAHPEGLTKETVGAVLWPDSSPGQLKLRFKKTIYRLRRALGQEVIVFEQDRYRFNRGLDFEYDVDLFWGKLEQARRSTNLVEQIAANRDAIDLYKGPYLIENDNTWVLPERERLWRAYEEAVLEVAEHHLESAEYGMALKYCQRILSEDPCQESAHRLAMRSHAAMGNRGAVLRQFERCQQALREEVDASPSPQTKTLIEALMQ